MKFTKLHTPAVRARSAQVLRWLVPAPEDAHRFWPEKGLDCDTSPYPELKRDLSLLPDVTDREYRAFYDRACQEENLAFDLPTKASLVKFTKLHIPAVRAISAQVLRWLVPAPEDAQLRSGNRFSVRQDLQDIFARSFFEVEGFSDPTVCAGNIIRFIIGSVFADVNAFAPKARPDYDNYPTVVVQDSPSSKKNFIDHEEYMVRFRES